MLPTAAFSDVLSSLSSGNPQRGEKGWSEPDRTNGELGFEAAAAKICSNVQEASRSRSIIIRGSLSGAACGGRGGGGLKNSFDFGASSSGSDIWLENTAATASADAATRGGERIEEGG